MRVNLEIAHHVCDNCGTVSKGIVLESEFAETVQDTIQLCNTCTVEIAQRMLEQVRYAPRPEDTVPTESTDGAKRQGAEGIGS